MSVSVLILLLSIMLEPVCSDNGTDFRIHLVPEDGLELIVEEVITVEGFLELDPLIFKDPGHINFSYFIHLDIPNTAVARLLDNSTIFKQYDEGRDLPRTRLYLNVSFQVQGVFLGRTEVLFYSGNKSDDRYILPVDYPIVVLRPPNPLSDIFLYSIAVVIAVNGIGFGCTIDLEVVKELLKKPIAPIIGLSCQFVLNPLIAYGSGVLFGLPPALALGLFAFGCSPGGGNSNLWSLVLDADVDLSILMTFASIVASFGMVPLWMNLLGRSLAPEHIQIPFKNMNIALAGVLVPCLIGLGMRRFLPRAAAFIRRILKPVSIIVIILIIPLAIYTNLYVFSMMSDWKIIGSSLSLPYAAFGLSSIISWICRQPRARILTIAIETAIQNMAIATVMLLTSLPSPEGDIAAAMPITAAIFTPIPLYGILIIKQCRQIICSTADTGKNGHIQNNNKDKTIENGAKHNPTEKGPTDTPVKSGAR